MSEDSIAPNVDSWRRTGHFVLYAVALWTAFVFLNFPASVGEVGLDDSWRQSLAILLKSGAQAGTEWVHSYGPLGHFGTVMYDSDLFFAGWIWEILTKIALVFTWLKLTKPVTSPWMRIAVLVVLTLFLSWTHPDANSLILLTSLALVMTVQENQPSGWLILLVTLFFAVFSHIKFVYFIFCALVMLLSEVQYRIREAKTILSPLPLFVLFYVCFWMITGQSFSNFPEYLKGSLETAGGYVEAMANPGETSEVFFALLIAAILAGVAVVRFKGRRLSIVPLIVCMTGLFLSWKHGFVRQESHSILFFSYTFFLSVILFAEPKTTHSKTESRLPQLVLCISLILSAFLMVNSRWAKFINQTPIGAFRLLQICYWRMESNHLALFHPFYLKILCEEAREQLAEKWKVPQIRSIVGRRTADVFSYEQGIAFLNELNWRPRPVFQSFHTFTPYLVEINAKFIGSELAPDFILYKLQTTDRRFPTLDDNQALFGLLKWYIPLVAERSYLLLKRIEDPSVVKENFGSRVVTQRKIRFGEEVSIREMPGRFQKLTLSIEQSIPGKVRSFLFRPPLLTIRVKTSNREQLDFRLISSIAAQGMLLNPFLQSTGDFARLYGLRDRGRVVSFRVMMDENADLWFRNEIGMVLESISRPTSVLIEDSKIQELASAIDSH